MKTTRFNRLLSLILCIVLIAAMALTCTGCATTNTGDTTPTSTTAEKPAPTVLGEGETKFTFIATALDGTETTFEIHTDEKKVGAALAALNLLSGDEGAYGLYVKTVNGITLDYNKDGKYWAFYVDGEYAMSGVDTTDIVEGASYAFKPE